MQNTNESFIVSSQKIEIPEEFRTIVVRTNHGKFSPFGKTITPTVWPESGSVKGNGNPGIFGVLLSQDFIYLQLSCFVFPIARFIILEVDSRTLSTSGLVPNIEVEFKVCNILFNGYIEDFIERIQKYATGEQLERMHHTIDFKIRELQEATQNPDTMLKYIAEVLLRNFEVTCSKAPILKMKQIISGLQK